MRTLSLSSIDTLREARWFDAVRAREYRAILCAVMLATIAFWWLGSAHGIDREGKPIGTDFLAFWSAAKLALAGQPAAAYDVARLYAVERGAMPVDPGVSPFAYPPPFLLLCLPLGLLPYLLSLGGWLIATGTAYALVVHRWLGARMGGRGAALTILGFPAVMSNIGHGQNGLLLTALLGGGLWLLDRRPWLAGVLLGMLVIKPQIALAIPVLVLASGRWRVMLAGIATALLLCATSLLAFGTGVWKGFVAGSGVVRGVLERGMVEPGKMVSPFAAVRVLHGDALAGYLAQGLVAIAAAALLAVVVRRTRDRPEGQAALCAAASVAMSPYFFDYDLAVTAIPLAWLYSEGVRRGFLPWEKLILVAAYVLPLVARDLALRAGVPIAPLVLAALLWAVARAALRSSPSRR